tara:strand:- start:1652 stop:2233 length:582 start_codon:yes stop_codon:yes gene_type:complete
MKIEKVKISQVKNNPNNPRVIKNDDFRKLVKSIKEAPWMLQLRSIIVNDDNVVLGGNQRLRACKEAGLKEIYIIRASSLTEEQQREFTIKDNSSYGEWDWDMLANEFETDELSDWGLRLPKIYFDDDDDPVIDQDNFAKTMDTYINAKVKQITLFFNSDDYEKAIDNLEIIRQKENLTDNTQVFNFLIEKYGL